MLESHHNLITRRWTVAENDKIFLVVPSLGSQEENTISLFSRLIQGHILNAAEVETCAVAIPTISRKVLYIGAIGLAAHSQSAETVRP